MRVVRFLDILFISCNILVAGLLTISFLRAEASANPNKKSTPKTTEIPSPQYADQQLKLVAEAINTHRRESGLKPLVQSRQLDTVAQERAQDMSHKAYYAHKNPEGKFFDSLLVKQGTEYGYACENLNMSESPDALQFVNSWQSSPAHRNCMLDDRLDSAGYAVIKVHVSNGIPINQYIVVAIYTQSAR